MTSTPYETGLVIPGMVAAAEEREPTPAYEQWWDDDRDVDYDELGGES